MIEIFPHEVLAGKLLTVKKVLPKSNNHERNLHIWNLFKQYKNKTRVGRMFGISATAVSKILAKLEREMGDEVVHSLGLDVRNQYANIGSSQESQVEDI